MPRSIVALIIVLVVLIGGIVLLSMKTSHKEPVRVEKVVPLENLAK